MPELIQIELADRRLLDGIASSMREAAEKSGDWLVCRPGCTSCCLGPFEITPLDAIRLRHGLQALESADPDRAARLHSRLALYMEQDHAPCPVLDPATGLCDLYESRPITCRLFGPVTRVEEGLAACELCYGGASQEEMARCAVDVDPQGLESEILAAFDDQSPTTVADALRRP